MSNVRNFEVGDKVVMKTNWSIIYIVLQFDIDNINAKILDPNGVEVTRPIIALEKYDAVRAFGL